MANRIWAAMTTFGSPKGWAVLLTASWLALGQTASWGQTPSGKPAPDKVPKEAVGSRPVTDAGASPSGPGGALVVPGGGFPGGGSGSQFAPGGRTGFAGNFSGFGGGLAVPERFTFKIDPKTPLTDLLPMPPVMTRLAPPWLVKDLAQVPEVVFQKALQIKVPSAKELQQGDKTEIEKLLLRLQAERHNAMQQIAHTLAKINHLNQKETDHFVNVLAENRADLAGLPFVLGDACRMSKGVSRQFIGEVAQVRATLSPPPAAGGSGGSGFSGGMPSGFVVSGPGPGSPAPPTPPTADEIAQAKIAALMQMLAPEPMPRRKEMVKTLAGMEHRDSTRALTRLAVFSLEKEVRDVALAALKKRPKNDMTEILRRGLRYPWPPIAQNAAVAVAELKRHDLTSDLVELLDEPDPRTPVEQKFQGRIVPVVREVVRLNHHHNCITCHTPATSDADFNKAGVTGDFVTGAVSIPGIELMPPSQGYQFGNQSPDIVIRADVTYLRQDFSLLQKVDNAEPWPAQQRFDFLVRTREVTPKEVAAYQSWLKQQGPTYRPPNQQAALLALRRITGLTAEPTAAAWREALGLDE